jgi:hypothetical protein
LLLIQTPSLRVATVDKSAELSSGTDIGISVDEDGMDIGADADADADILEVVVVAEFM